MSRSSGSGRTTAAVVREMFEAPKLALDRTPVLQGVFERFATACGEGLRSLCVPQCTFMLNAVTGGSTWDLIEGYEDGICGIFYSPEWDARIPIGLDRRFVFSFAEATFGGDGTEQPYESDRPFSTVEIRTMKQVFEVGAAALQALLQVIDRTTLILERVETRLDFSSIGLADAPAVMSQLIAQVFEGGGRMFVLVPQSALVPFRRKLERQQSPEPQHQDRAWAQQLLSEIGRADVRLDAVLDGAALPLGEIAKFHVNQILRLQATTETLLTLEALGEPLFRCRLGQSDGSFTVRVEAPVDHSQELLGEIMSSGSKS